jgi:hypothetical protein
VLHGLLTTIAISIHKDILAPPFWGFDPDCDGDTDLLLGDVGSEFLTFLKNGGTKSKAFITQLENRFPSKSESSRHFIFANAFYLDINNDGKKDLITTVNESSNSQTKNLIYYYENSGMGVICNTH